MALKKPPPKTSRPVKKGQTLRQARLRHAATVAARSNPSRPGERNGKNS